jgi:hypothetical protein
MLSFAPIVVNLDGRAPTHVFATTPSEEPDPTARDLDITYAFPSTAPGFNGDGRVRIREQPLLGRGYNTAEDMYNSFPSGQSELLNISGTQVFMYFGPDVTPGVPPSRASANFSLKGIWVTIEGPAITPDEVQSLAAQIITS